MTYTTSGWAVGPVTFTDAAEKESERIGVSLFGQSSIVMEVESAKCLVRQLVLLIDDAQKAKEESK